jgi:flagellar protein FliL
MAKEKETKQEAPKETKPEAPKKPEKGKPEKEQPSGKEGKDTKGGKTGKEDKGKKEEGKQPAEAPAKSKAQALRDFFKKGFSNLPIIIYALVALNLILMVSAMSYIYYIKFVYKRPIVTEKSAKAEIDEKKDGTAEIIEYKLDPFTVNMSKAKGKRYVNAKFDLIAVNWETRDELDKKVDKIRDAIIKILDDKYPEELITVQGKLFLKDQIVTEVNRILSRGSIKEVFIESFLIQ